MIGLKDRKIEKQMPYKMKSKIKDQLEKDLKKDGLLESQVG